MPLVPIVVFAGLTYSVGTEIVLDGSLRNHEFEDKSDLCSDEGDVSCGTMFARKDKCEDDDCL